MQAASRLELIALLGIPAIALGDDLVELTLAALENSHLRLDDGDVLVFAQKIISKAEGRRVNLATVQPSARALALATETGKDPRLVELILQESVRVVRVAKDVLIVEHRRGYIMANAGLDQSLDAFVSDESDPPIQGPPEVRMLRAATLMTSVEARSRLARDMLAAADALT